MLQMTGALSSSNEYWKKTLSTAMISLYIDISFHESGYILAFCLSSFEFLKNTVSLVFVVTYATWARKMNAKFGFFAFKIYALRFLFVSLTLVLCYCKYCFAMFDRWKESSLCNEMEDR